MIKEGAYFYNTEQNIFVKITKITMNGKVACAKLAALKPRIGVVEEYAELPLSILEGSNYQPAAKNDSALQIEKKNIEERQRENLAKTLSF